MRSDSTPSLVYEVKSQSRLWLQHMWDWPPLDSYSSRWYLIQLACTPSTICC